MVYLSSENFPNSQQSGKNSAFHSQILLNPASREAVNSRIPWINFAFSRIPHCILVKSRIPKIPFQTLQQHFMYPTNWNRWSEDFFFGRLAVKRIATREKKARKQHKRSGSSFAEQRSLREGGSQYFWCSCRVLLPKDPKIICGVRSRERFMIECCYTSRRELRD